MMTIGELENLTKEVLLPLLPGSLLEGSKPSTPRETAVALVDLQRIAIKLRRQDLSRVVVFRPQPFGQMNSPDLNECDVVKAFQSKVMTMEPGLISSYKDDLKESLVRSIVAASVVGNANGADAVLRALHQLQQWSLVSYEGGKIATSMAISLDTEGLHNAFEEVCSLDAAMVLSNGFDTLMHFGHNGKLIGHTPLPNGVIPGKEAPVRMAALAAQSSATVVVLVLNRLGEILVFRDQKLVFARRFGRWFFITHQTALNQMRHPHDRTLRREVYASALDSSFARTGACLGAVAAGKGSTWKNIVSENDQLATSETPRANMFRAVIAGMKFQDLDRRLRQELLAVDGATLVDHTGAILTVGAILKVPGGSEGGGRRAAAIELGTLGVGLKVSQDGGITGFKGTEEPAFRIMAQ